MLSKLGGREKEYFIIDTVSDLDVDFNHSEDMYTTDFLNTIKMSGLPHHKIVLKIV